MPAERRAQRLEVRLTFGFDGLARITCCCCYWSPRCSCSCDCCCCLRMRWLPACFVQLSPQEINGFLRAKVIPYTIACQQQQLWAVEPWLCTAVVWQWWWCSRRQRWWWGVRFVDFVLVFLFPFFPLFALPSGTASRSGVSAVGAVAGVGVRLFLLVRCECF